MCQGCNQGSIEDELEGAKGRAAAASRHRKAVQKELDKLQTQAASMESQLAAMQVTLCIHQSFAHAERILPGCMCTDWQ